MKLKTHVFIAKVALENKNINKFNRILFYLGCMYPDLTPTQFIHKHFYNNSWKYIDTKINKIEKKRFFKMFTLGKMAHYCSDFCCTAHEVLNYWDVLTHLDYERNLQKYMLSSTDKIKKLYNNMNLNCDKIEDAINYYKQGKKFSFNYDLLMSIYVSNLIVKLA